jgi:hypothetical protein
MHGARIPRVAADRTRLHDALLDEERATGEEAGAATTIVEADRALRSRTDSGNDDDRPVIRHRVWSMRSTTISGEAPTEADLPEETGRASMPDRGALRERIATRAFEIWKLSGEPTGRDADIWLAAEHEVLESPHPQSR